MSHLTEDDRKIISNMLAHKATCKEIAERIGCDPTTISKEIKKNRVISKEAKGDKKILCKKLERFPFVCNGCHQKDNCPLDKWFYNPATAEKNYRLTLVNSRSGIDQTPDDFEKINNALELNSPVFV